MPRSAAVVLAMLLALMLAPSTSAPPGTRMVASAAPPADLWIGSLQTVDSLNPYIGVNDASYLLYGLLYDYPFAFDQDGNFVSSLLTDAVCTDASCMNWTYTVRTGVRWSDGSNLTVADVAFTWNYDSQNLFHLWAYEPYFNQVVLCTGTNQGHCGAVISGTDQVTLYFQRPFAAGKDLFAPIVQEAQWSAVSPQAAETTYQNPNPIGTGPFIADPNIYTEWQNQLNANVAFHLFKNPSYHPVGSNPGITNISNIYLKVYQDVNKMVFDFKAGTIQLAAMTTDSLAAVKGLPNILTQTPLQAIQEWNEIGISQIDTKAADGRLNPARFDRNVRLAMAHATNKDDIIQTFYHGQGQRGDSLVSPITPQWWYDPVSGGDNLTYNLTLANAILNASGWTGTWSDSTGTYRLNPSPITVSYQTACYQCMNPPNVTTTIPAGTHLEFTLAVRPTSQFPEETDTANYLVTAYQQIGIKVYLKVEATEQALETDVYGGNVEMYIWYWSADPDPNYILSMQSSWTLDGWSDNYWNNASYNRYYIGQLGDTNVTQRVVDAQAAQRIQYESATYIIYIYPFGQWAMRTDLWEGWGNWTEHPYRQMNAYWGANPLWFDLNCPSCASPPMNEPPTPPVIAGNSNVTTQSGVNTTFTATSTDPEASDTLNFTWDWGDGNSSTTTTPATNPVSTSGHVWILNATETYHIYDVTVRVSDGWNAPVYGTNVVHVNVTLPLLNPGHFQGTVLDTSGNPIINAQVAASPGGYIGVTSGDGAYALDAPPGTYNLTAGKPLFIDQTKTGTVASGETVIVNFALAPNVGWIAGTATNGLDGTAVQGAEIRVTDPGGVQTSTSTDSNGKYNITATPESYSVAAIAAGFATQTKTGIVIALSATTMLNFTMVPSYGLVKGKATSSASGSPLQGAEILATGGSGGAAGQQKTTLTDAEGNYTLTLNPGSYWLNVSLTGYGSASEANIIIEAGVGAEVNFSLVPTLIVTAGSGGTGRAGAATTLTGTIEAAEPGNWTLYFGDSTSTTGLFAIGMTTISESHVYAAEGTYTLRLYATIGSLTRMSTASALIDGTPPTTTPAPAGTAGNNSWFRSSVQVTLSATDAMSGVASTSYSVDGGSWQTYAAAFSISGDGNHTVDYRSTDVAGNVEATKTLLVRIDTGLPTVVASDSGTRGVGVWYVSNVTVTLGATDGMSGVAAVRYSVDSGAWQTYTAPFVLGNGEHSVSLLAIDVAGNTRPLSIGVSVDTIAPSVAIRNPSAGSVFSSPDVMLNWTASDATSGLSTVQVSIDNGSPTTPSQPPTLLGGLADGTHTVTIRVTDQAGNVATASVTFTVKTATSAGLDPLVIGSVGAVVVVAAIVAVLLLRRRAGRKPKQPSEP